MGEEAGAGLPAYPGVDNIQNHRRVGPARMLVEEV